MKSLFLVGKITPTVKSERILTVEIIITGVSIQLFKSILTVKNIQTVKRILEFGSTVYCKV
jgi:hypothetical protein